jgi:hypothetical protein
MISLHDGGIESLQVAGRELTSSGQSGFVVRDMAAPSVTLGFVPGPGMATDSATFLGVCHEAGLAIEARFLAEPGCISVSGRIRDTRHADRAITLSFALPVEAAGWRWGDDIRRHRIIGRSGRYEYTEAAGCGSGAMSLYPLGAIWDEATGLALAIDMAHPAQFRIGYSGEDRTLSVHYDFGLVPETERCPGGAEFAFVIYRFDPEWGFRAAFQKLTDLFPAAFAVRSRNQGIWMPFTDIGTLPAWQDFGFRYHEAGKDHAFDRRNGILPFRYTELMTWWMAMEPGVPRTDESAREVHKSIAHGPEGRQRELAQALDTSAMEDANGRRVVAFHNFPWCNGAVWALNPSPFLPGQPTGASVLWSEQIKARTHGAASLLAGEYLDSLEGYTTPDLNYRREHFRTTTVPLSFDAATGRPALFKGLAVFELTRWMSEEMHRMGKLLFANGVPYRFPFLVAYLDIMGTETVWLDEQGNYRPASDAQMSLWRTLSYRKPYLLLQNTRFNAFTADMVEKYFLRCLFYGIFPSMFSANASESRYWENPAWYERDRPHFRRYLPLIKRVAEAGWNPITLATVDNPGIFVERFGTDETDDTYLTLMNGTSATQTGRVSLGNRMTRPGRAGGAEELVSNTRVALSAEGRFLITLEPDEVRVLHLS